MTNKELTKASVEHPRCAYCRKRIRETEGPERRMWELSLEDTCRALRVGLPFPDYYRFGDPPKGQRRDAIRVSLVKGSVSKSVVRCWRERCALDDWNPESLQQKLPGTEVQVYPSMKVRR